jgi:ribosomal protein L11
LKHCEDQEGGFERKDIEAAVKIIAGTARSMGIEVVDEAK